MPENKHEAKSYGSGHDMKHHGEGKLFLSAEERRKFLAPRGPVDKYNEYGSPASSNPDR